MEIHVKSENYFLCHGCLCSNRQMFPLGENTDMYYNLIGVQKNCLSHISNDIMLCWECTAVLRKFKIFQRQIMKARNILTQFSYEHIPLPDPLSNLVSTTKDYCDHEMKYEPEFNVTINDTETQTKNKNHEIQLDCIFDDSENCIRSIKNEMDALFDDEDTFGNDVKDDNIFGMVVQDDELSGDVDVKNDVSQMPEKTSKTILDNYILITAKQIEWGDYKSYFDIVFLDEKEFELNIVAKDRKIPGKKTKLKFNCSVCKLEYKHSLDFKRHNDLNHLKEGSRFTCSFCQTTVSSKIEFQSHWRTHTPAAKCKLCECVLRPRGMTTHLNYVHVARYSCKRCGGGFGTKLAFEKHYNDAHMTFICDYCNMKFKTKPKLAKHIKDVHMQVQCIKCNKIFVNWKRYEKHCELLHPELSNSEKIADEDCYCVECNKQYKTIQQYKEHLNYSIKHVDLKKGYTKCPECGKVFAKKSYMNNHYKLFHLKKTKFYCQPCDKYFARGFGLKVHNQSVHEKVPKIKNKICDLCGRAFSSQTIMQNHRRTHTGERPFKCLYCTAEFIQKYAMTSHMRTQHQHPTTKK